MKYLEKSNWSLRELLALASAVAENKQMNWRAISQQIRDFAEQGRPYDWCAPKACAQEYGKLLESFDNSRKKSEMASLKLTIEEYIVKRLTVERIDELRSTVHSDSQRCNSLQAKCDALHLGTLDISSDLEQAIHRIQEHINECDKVSTESQHMNDSTVKEHSSQLIVTIADESIPLTLEEMRVILPPLQASIPDMPTELSSPSATNTSQEVTVNPSPKRFSPEKRIELPQRRLSVRLARKDSDCSSVKSNSSSHSRTSFVSTASTTACRLEPIEEDCVRIIKEESLVVCESLMSDEKLLEETISHSPQFGLCDPVPPDEDIRCVNSENNDMVNATLQSDLPSEEIECLEPNLTPLKSEFSVHLSTEENSFNETVKHNNSDEGDGDGDNDVFTEQKTDESLIMRSPAKRRKLCFNELFACAHGENASMLLPLPHISTKPLPRRQLVQFLELISNHRLAHVFERPVRKTSAPRYFEVVKRPMDLMTLRKNVEGGRVLGNINEFERDLLLIFVNGVMYNSTDQPVHSQAQEMGEYVLQEFHTVLFAATELYELSSPPPAEDLSRRKRLRRQSDLKTDSES